MIATSNFTRARGSGFAPTPNKQQLNAYICSVYWRPRKKEVFISTNYVNGVPYPSGSTIYQMDACKRDEYRVIEVVGGYEFPSSYTETGGMAYTIVQRSAIEVARDLVKEWANSGQDTSGGPGIAVMEPSDYTVYTDENGAQAPLPTAEFLEKLREHQRLMAVDLVQRGHAMHISGQRPLQAHISAVEYIWGADGERHYPWARSAGIQATKDCYACGEQIAIKALVCKQCRTNLAEFLKTNKLEPFVYDDAVRAHMDVLYAPRRVDNIKRLEDAVKEKYPKMPDMTRDQQRQYIADMNAAKTEGKRLNDEAKAEESARAATRHGAGNETSDMFALAEQQK